MREINRKKTGLRIYQQIDKAGYTIPEATREMELSGNFVLYRWCSGYCLPQVDKLFRLAEMCHCRMDDLIVVEEV